MHVRHQLLILISKMHYNPISLVVDAVHIWGQKQKFLLSLQAALPRSSSTFSIEKYGNGQDQYPQGKRSRRLNCSSGPTIKILGVSYIHTLINLNCLWPT